MENAQVARRNLDRFLTTTGKTKKEPYEWASEVGRWMHIYTVAHLALIPTPLPADMDPERVDE